MRKKPGVYSWHDSAGRYTGCMVALFDIAEDDMAVMRDGTGVATLLTPERAAEYIDSLSLHYRCTYRTWDALTEELLAKGVLS